jgi:catechol 2,3-dioxygenase-like lactoylglutathione lyase family enzyme
MKRLVIALGTLALAGVVLAQPAGAPAGRAPTGLVVGSGNYFSANAAANPQLRAMFGLPDARLRWQIGRAPPIAGGVEIVEVSNANAKPVARRVQDPGAVTLVATVRDLDATLARVKRMGARVATRSGVPVRLSIGTQQARMVVVQDPAGHFVELVQPDQLSEAQAAATTNVVGVRVRFTVNDVERSLRLYRDVLGLHALGAASEYRNEAPVLDAIGLSGGQYRVAPLEVPASGLQFTLIDFTGVERRTVRARIQDPGSTRIQLRVANIDAAIGALGKAGGTFVSTGGKPLDLPAGDAPLRVGIVRDPNNLFLVLIESPPR